MLAGRPMGNVAASAVACGSQRSYREPDLMKARPLDQGPGPEECGRLKTRRINVHLLPSLVDPDELPGSTVVIVDVLRATTTIAYALAAGAKRIIPCLQIEDARALAKETQGPWVLGGERQGMIIEGFDLGNSPAEYTPQRVADRTVIFTTTNGTSAMIRCQSCENMIMASFANFSACCDYLASVEQIEIVCAGTDGTITREDSLLAGALTDFLQQQFSRSGDRLEWNDQAAIAADAWRQAAEQLATTRLLSDQIRRSLGARNLIELGMENDIEIASTLDQVNVVPRLDPRVWEIRSA